MKRSTNPCLVLLLAVVLAGSPAAPLLATCGGGGGGGVGGAVAGATGEPVTYQVPWTVLPSGQEAVRIDDGVALLWFPVSADEARASDLQTSRTLTLLSSQCLRPLIATSDNDKLRAQHQVGAAEAVVLTDAAGAELARLPEPERSLRASDVEKMVRAQLKQAEDAADERFDQARDKAKAGEQAEAIVLFREVMAQGCLAGKTAKKAGKELKKLGVEVSALSVAPAVPFDLSARTERRIVQAMTRAVLAERHNDLTTARAGYERAHALDPADPVPLRFLAELHRHHTGDWALAARQFRTLLAGSPDAISRAVALHGLGKMTIHAGRFDEGLALFERSLAAYPLALTYRNLAVYWNSEGERARAEGYTEQALALAPDDAYNQIFAATYLAENGEAAAALAVAKMHQELLPASYNLAAIHALLGHRDQALALLERHFYSYEQYDAVRKKEMQEARDDVVFARYHQDPEFVALTAMADSDPDSFRRELSDTGSR